MPTEPMNGIGSLLETAPPPVTTTEADRVAQQVFGLCGVITPLSGERDSNFHIKVNESAQFVLKISHPAEDPLVIAFQSEALNYIAARTPDLPVPRLLPTRDGNTAWSFTRRGDPPRTARVLSYLSGEPLHPASTGTAQRQTLGRVLARLGQALHGFDHPGARHELMWDITHAGQTRGLLDHIPDPHQRALALRFLDSFETHAQPALPALRAQVIHNDLNPHNVLVGAQNPDQVAGIIDFGDMVHAPLINDLAVAAAYHPVDTGHPLSAMADLIAGYHAKQPLTTPEIDLLFDLIAARMVVSVAISGWRAARHPENKAYILRNNRLAWTGLQRFNELSRQQAQDYFHTLCQRDCPDDHDQRL